MSVSWLSSDTGRTAHLLGLICHTDDCKTEMFCCNELAGLYGCNVFLKQPC